jgi:hypothetical protein
VPSGARSPALPGFAHVSPLRPDHFAGYLTVYYTVLLVSPFLRPTVTVTPFSGTQERDRPVTNNALSDDLNGAG